MRKYSIICLSVLLFTACAKDFRFVDENHLENKIFTASIEIPADLTETKTLLGGKSADNSRSVLWQPGDEVYVTNGTSAALFRNTETSLSKKAVLEGSIADASSYYACYPYSMVSSYSSGEFTINLPSRQKYYADGIDSDSNPMVAKTDSGEFNFKNLCGILVLNIVGTDTIASITFSGNNSTGEPINVSGTGTVSSSYTSEPELIMSSTASNSVTLDCVNTITNRGVALSKTNATPFHIVLPAATYSSFHLSIRTTDGMLMNVTSNKALITSRSQRTTTSQLTYSGKVEPKYVDLGLSVKWATFNVGADKPEDYGDYYAWGEIYKKDHYYWSNYKYCKGGEDLLTKYCNISKYGYRGYTDDKTVLDLGDDVAYVNWGGDWRMPTDAEWSELLDNCTWTWTTLNGIKGYKVIGNKEGYTDRYIFLPAAGGWSDSTLGLVGSYGVYSSSSLYESGPYNACVVSFCKNYYRMSEDTRKNGQSVRPVCP